MMETRQYSRLEKVTFTLTREDILQLLHTAAKIPSSGFKASESSIDGDWPLVITFVREDSSNDGGA